MQSSEGRSSRVSAAEPQEGEGRSNGTRVNSVLSTRTAGMISDSNQASTSGDIPPRLGNRTKFSVAGLPQV
jgi:hypothetical protein